MKRLRIAGLIVAALLLIGAASAGGYLIASDGAADEGDRIAAKEAASKTAFARATLESMSSSLARGLEQGRIDGEQRALDEGSSAGTVAGQKVAGKETEATLISRRGGGNDGGLVDGTGPITSGPGPGPLDGSGGVLVVGDSLEVLTIPYLDKYLSGVNVTTNAVGGYNSFQIYDLFQESYDPSQSVIVFDAGTNDNPNYPEILAGNLEKVAGQIGNRCLVVPTIHGLIVDGVGNDGKNQVVTQFASSRPGTQTPDWAGAVAQHPELMQADDLHPIAAGADLRAQIIAEGVRACLGGSAF